MSFGYLVMTSRACHDLMEIRKGVFNFIGKYLDWYVYFRFCEGDCYTVRDGEKKSKLTQCGINFLKYIYDKNRGEFIFADVLLKNREGELDYVEQVVKLIKNEKLPVAKLSRDLKINLRQAYLIKI